MFALSNLLRCPAGGNNFFLLFAQGDWSAYLVHREPSTLDQFDDSQKGNIASFPGFMSCSWSLIKMHHWVALSDNNKPTDWGKRKFFLLAKTYLLTVNQYNNLTGAAGLICLHQVRQKSNILCRDLFISFSVLPNYLQALCQKLCILPFALLWRNCQESDHHRWERVDFRKSGTK